MAEIRLEEKKGGNGWIWWLLGIILLGLLAWVIADALFDGDDDDVEEVTMVEPVETEPVVTEPVMADGDNAISNYLTWWNADMGKMTVEHETTHNGLTNLASALGYAAMKVDDVSRAGVQAELDKMNNLADNITEDWDSGEHADQIKKALQQASMVFEKIQMASYPDMADEISMLKKQAADIDPATLTLDQKGQVKDYFQKAADVLTKMNI